MLTKKIQAQTKRRYLLRFKIQRGSVKRAGSVDQFITINQGLGLNIENEDWANNLTKDNTIQLDSLNKSFTYTIDISKNQCIAFVFLLGEFSTDLITTKYILE